MKAAVIGCGNIGKKRAAQVIAHASSRLALVVDSDPVRASALASELGTSHAVDWRRAVDAGVDAAVVAVPTRFAYDIVSGLLDAGVHVLCEKPLGLGLTQARALTARARERDVVLETGFNLRFDPGLQHARARVRDGAIGEPYFAKIDYVNGVARSNTNGVGSLLDMGVHSLDLAQWILGALEPVAAAMTAHEFAPDDNGFAVLRAADVLVQVHWSFVRWRNLFRLEVSGSRGYVVVESLPKWGPQTVVEGTRVYPSGAPREERRTFEGDQSWAGQWAHFVDVVAGRAPHEAEAGLRCMELADQLRELAGTPMHLHR